MARDLKQVAATGDVATGPVVLRSVTLTAGSDAASVVLRDGSSGNPRLTLKAAANTTAVWRAGSVDGVLFASALHATLTGTSPACAFEYD